MYVPTICDHLGLSGGCGASSGVSSFGNTEDSTIASFRKDIELTELCSSNFMSSIEEATLGLDAHLE